MRAKHGPLRDFLREFPFAVLLGGLLLMIIGSPFSGKIARTFPIFDGYASISPFVLILTIAAALSIWSRVRSRPLTVILGVLVLVFLYLSTAFSQDSLQTVHLVAQLIFLIYILIVVVRIVFRAPVVDGNILCGAACVYLLIGVLFGFIYALVEFLRPGSFILPSYDVRTAANAPVLNVGWLVYFSLTTLTTVSFGDIMPSTEIARSMSTLEAVVGQIIMVLMMARLVGLHVAQTSSKERHHPTLFEVSDHLPEEKSPRKDEGSRS